MTTRDIICCHRALALLMIAISSLWLAQQSWALEYMLSEDDRLMLENLATAPSEQQGRQAESALWEHWFDLAPTQRARELLDHGRERREAYDYEAAEALFDELIALAPTYFEAYNQRAFVRFLRQNYSGSLSDLEKTLELYPNHFGALSGLYHVMLVDSRIDDAMKALKRAVTIHPWLKERGQLPESMWPDSYRAIHEPQQGI